jgi:hypothetical protein
MASRGHLKPWAIDAEKARPRAETLAYGEREAGIKNLAGELGLNPQTLRRSLSAIEFVEALAREADFPAEQLKSYPLAAVEYLNRWFRRDKRRALVAGKELLAGKYPNVEQLRQAEQDSRKDVFESTGKALEIGYRRLIKDRVTADVKTRHPDVEFHDVADPTKGPPLSMVDFAFAGADGTPWVGVVIVGPYRDQSLYERRATDAVSRAFTLLRSFKYVDLVLPDNCNPEIFYNLTRKLKLEMFRELEIRQIFAGDPKRWLQPHP